MHCKRLLAILVTLSFVLAANSAIAALQFDQNVTNNAIWGGGNQNGGFTVERNLGIEVGLRAKVRNPIADDSPAGIKSQGNGTYGSFAATSHGVGRASWNVDWSINSNYDGTGNVLSAYTYVFERDYDPGAGVLFVQPAYLSSDPINGPLAADHSFGDNSTGQSSGVEIGIIDPVGDYTSFISTYSLAQNSTNLDFEDVGGIFNPTADGLYTFQLSAYNRATGGLIARTMIDVVVGNGVVPEATALLTWSGLIACVGLVRRRRVED